MKVCTELKVCVCCGSSNLETVLDLNDQPLANSYVEDLYSEELIFPLRLNFCLNCTHLQLSHVVNPDYIFKNYLYVSGTSKTLLEYFDWFVDFTENYVSTSIVKRVLDIANNDGSLLNSYKNKGYITYGIDPAENLYEISSKNHNIICDYLTKDNISSFGVKFDIITAQNVFAHNSYPEDFLLACKTVLSDSGCIFIQTSQACMIQNNEYDTIYHEHLSFFNSKSFIHLANRCGFEVQDVVITPIHGKSYVFVLRKLIAETKNTSVEEEFNDVRTLDLMKEYSYKCQANIINLKNIISIYKDKGYKVIGYGAAAKGNTLLNFGKIYLDYIVDDNDLKHNLYTPGMRIPIKSPDVLLEETEAIVIIPLAWNFFDEIKVNVLKRKSDVIFIKYFPNIEIING